MSMPQAWLPSTAEGCLQAGEGLAQGFREIAPRPAGLVNRALSWENAG